MRSGAAAQVLSCWQTAADPNRSLEKVRDHSLFSQIAIVILGLFLVVMGFIEVNPLTGGLGALVAIFAGHTLYKLTTGK